jgi:hypothetical protein
MATTPLGLGGGLATANQLAAFFPGTASAIVSAPTPLLAVQRALWRQVDCLWSGTAGMRVAGEAYLPRQPNELKANYDRRLARSTLHNYYKSSIQSAVGKVFAKDIHVERPSVGLQLVLADIDAQGRNLTQFAKDVLMDAINHGASFILIDHTRVPQEFTSLAEKNSSGARPYWIGIQATRVLDARSADFGGSQRLSYFRYEEEVWEPSSDGFSGSGYRQVRIFRQDPGTEVLFAVYREENGGAQWVLVDSGVLTGLSAIPVVPVYSNRVGFFMGRPPLQDLADVNVQHWQCLSDYQNSVHVATIPFLLTKGLKAQLDDDGNPKELVIDVNAGIVATNPDATVEWVEVSGAALAAARENIDSLVSEMEKLGTTLCTQTPGGVTATEKSVNAAEANSTVKAWALALQDAVNSAVAFTAEYLGEPAQALAQVNTEYADDYASDTTFSSVLEAHKLGVIDAETVIAEGKRRNIFDPSAEIQVPADAEPVQAGTAELATAEEGAEQ